MLLDGPQSWWEVAGLAAIAAIGQLAGKTLFYLAGRGVLPLPRLLPASIHAGANSSLPHRESRTARALARWKKRIEDQRWLAPVFVGTSASVGLPPFALVSAAAGALRISLPVFLIAGLAGRWCASSPYSPWCRSPAPERRWTQTIRRWRPGIAVGQRITVRTVDSGSAWPRVAGIGTARLILEPLRVDHAAELAGGTR